MRALLALLLTCAASVADAQVVPAVQVPLETGTGFGAVKAPAGYKALRIQGKSPADARVLAGLFADFAAHPSMFPRVVDDVEVLGCGESSIKTRYITKFDPKPGRKTKVESRSTVKVTVAEDRIEFAWSSDAVESDFVNAAWGRALFVRQRGPNGPETLIDYVSAIRPKNKAKGLLVESQKSMLAGDARYVIDQLITLGNRHHSSGVDASFRNTTLFRC